MKDTTVGIVMPAYNAQRYIGQAIRSVVDQTDGNWVLCVADDGSTDQTEQIVREFARQDDRIRWLEAPQGHTGVCGARARGIAATQTQWIAFLDSDDLWHPNKLRTQLEIARQEKAGFLFTASAFLDAEGQMLDYVHRVPEKIGYSEILNQNVIPCSSVLIRRALLEDCFQPRDWGLCEDFAAWIRILRERTPYALGIDCPLVMHRLVPGSESSSKGKAALRVWKTYRAGGLSRPEAAGVWLKYAGRSLKKYAKIAASGRRREGGTHGSGN